MPVASAQQLAVHLQDVALRYGSGYQALSGLQLQIRRGECVALIGPSGAGKTSLLSLLGTASMASSGRVQLLGQSVAAATGERALRSLRKRIGTVYQAPPLPLRQRVVTAVLAGRLGQWPWWRGLASLCYPVDAAGARAMLERVELADKLFVRCSQLSGGQLQRVGIARVLYQQPELVLADEPVSALDPALAQATVRLLVDDTRRRGATLVASLHAVGLALDAFDRVIGIQGGRILFDQPAMQVTEADLRALYGSDDWWAPSAAAWVGGARTARPAGPCR